MKAAKYLSRWFYPSAVSALFAGLRRLRGRFAAFGTIAAFAIIVIAAGGGSSWAQETIPPPPSDTTKIYLAGANGALEALPVETGTSSLNAETVASRDKKGYIELPGETAVTSIDRPLPRLYLFVPRGPAAHPAFLIHFDTGHERRRVPILAQKGLAGYAIPTDHIVIPHYRVLTTVGDLQFMEITPRAPLAPGEYAVLGADLGQLATFKVT